MSLACLHLGLWSSLRPRQDRLQSVDEALEERMRLKMSHETGNIRRAKSAPSTILKQNCVHHSDSGDHSPAKVSTYCVCSRGKPWCSSSLGSGRLHDRSCGGPHGYPLGTGRTRNWKVLPCRRTNGPGSPVGREEALIAVQGGF